MRATVIIPTCGRPVAVKDAIRSLLAADPGKFDAEILVVDNNTDESMSRDLRAACAGSGEPVRYTTEPSPGQSAARHRGAKEARGDILIYVDDDVQISAGWFDAYLEAFEDQSVGIAGGPSIPAFQGSIPAWLWDFLQPTPYGGWHCGWLSLIDIGATVDDIDPIWVWGLNFAIRREVLYHLRGFHPDLVPAKMQRWQGDGETGLTYRAKVSGVRCVHARDALLHHVIGADRLTPEYFAKRAYYQGICDSFTQIRAGAEPSSSAQGSRPVPQAGQATTAWALAAFEVKTRAVSAYNDGWMFHQREAASDPLLLAWIRREDFWEADIREEMRKRGMS